MTKQAGMGDRLYVAGYDISGDVGAVQTINDESNSRTVTGLDKSAEERQLLLADKELVFGSFFNDATDQLHDALAGLPKTDIVGAYFRGTTLGNPAFGLKAKQVNYDWNRGADGALDGTTQLVAAAGAVESWGQMATPGQRTDSAATPAPASIDGLVASAEGLVAYLQVFAFTGTSITLTIEESSDDGGGDAFAAVAGGAFAAVSSAPAFEMIETAAGLAVEQYLRVPSTGTFSNAVFAIVIARR